MLASPFLEFVRENAQPSGNFTVSLPTVHGEIAGAGERVVRGKKGERMTRDYVIDNVIRPLVNVSKSVRFLYTFFTPDGFGGEGVNLPKILTKVGREYQLVPSVDPIDGFRNFWGGLYDEKPQENSRGYVIFLIDDPNAKLNLVFSHCYDPAVMSAASLRKTLGPSIYKSIQDAIEANPSATVILLKYRISLSNLVVFPGKSIFQTRLEEAIASTRTFDISKADGK